MILHQQNQVLEKTTSPFSCLLCLYFKGIYFVRFEPVKSLYFLKKRIEQRSCYVANYIWLKIDEFEVGGQNYRQYSRWALT